eukprot:4300816-Pyramimonas_sp.AAC.1
MNAVECENKAGTVGFTIEVAAARTRKGRVRWAELVPFESGAQAGPWSPCANFTGTHGVGFSW